MNIFFTSSLFKQLYVQLIIADAFIKTFIIAIFPVR